MRSSLCPGHLLLFHHSFAHHLVHHRFHERRRDPLSVPVPLAVVGNVLLIIPDVDLKFSQLLQQFPTIPRASRRDFQLPLQIADALLGTLHIAVPQIPLQALQLFLYAHFPGSPTAACAATLDKLAQN